MKSKVMLGLVVVGLLAASYGLAGQAMVASVKAQVGFPFIVGAKTFPAGMYTFTPINGDREVRIEGQGMNVTVVVLTRLAVGIHETPGHSSLVFDTIGDKSWLSELWVPNQDGYLLEATKERHEHEIVTPQM